MKIAYGTYAMPNTPLEDALPLLAGIGYEGVEICISPRHVGSMPADLSAERRRRLRGLLTRHGLGIPALFVAQRHVLELDETKHSENLHFVVESAALARELGVERPVISLGIGGKTAQWDEVRSLIVERLGDYARAGAEHNFVLAAEAHVNAAVDRSERALWVMQQVNQPTVGLHFDIVHFFLAGEDEAEAVRRLLPITVHTHITDARIHSDGTFDLLLLGEGELDAETYVRTMYEEGWNDFITLEVSTRVWSRPDYDPTAAARQSYAALDRAFRAAQIPRG
jgi:sugar phosphate isomerase/epimerase